MIKKILHRILWDILKTCRYIKWEKYRKEYGFDKWHMVPKMGKPYIKDIINYIIKNGGGNEQTTIVECGCGLCDILADKSFQKCQRIGVERDERVFNALKEIYSKKTIKFINGSFQNINNMKIDWLIAVNFTHEISDEEMKINLNKLVGNNEIKNIILDEVTGNYKYWHDYSAIIPHEYEMKKMGEYRADGGKRQIKVFTKMLTDNSSMFDVN